MPLELVETPRLRLERWSASHADALVAINREPAVMRFLGDDGRAAPEEESRAQSDLLAAHWDRFGFGDWAVIERATGRVCGFTGLTHPLWFPDEAAQVEAGWRLHPGAWGRGYATEAGTAALRAGFGELALERIVSYIHPDNGPSKAVARRLGMTLGRTIAHPTRPHDLEVFEIARATWRAATTDELAADRPRRPPPRVDFRASRSS
jgi:RimJ/RimL family protein N-acetyltransferase